MTAGFLLCDTGCCVVVVDGSDAGQAPAGALDDATKIKQLEGLFLFALVWSTGATCDTAGRNKFDKFLRYVPRLLRVGCTGAKPQ